MRSVLTLERYELKLLQTYRLGWVACAARMWLREVDINLKREKQLAERERERERATNNLTDREPERLTLCLRHGTWTFVAKTMQNPIL